MDSVVMLKRSALSLVVIAFLSGCSSKKVADAPKNENKSAQRELVVLAGPAACGKGTVANKAKDILGFITVSTGDVLRQNVGQETDLGKKAKPIMEKGELVPDTLINDMVQDWLIQQATGTQPIILDGYPRTIGQAQALIAMLKDPKNAAYHLRVVRFTVSEKEVVDRIAYRVVCSNKVCQKVYSLKSLPPKVAGICDVCGGKLIKRKDDTEEVVRKRYTDYMKTEAEILAFFKSQGVEITEISAAQPMDQVFAAFKTAVIPA
ncbi:MAG: Adenylate kinase [candidate division TM6 bacterium GW2011_GWE2_42_60]|nr:MAG: Adenylate kinase [candidate division TM6 bacterium GW2011_GWE2_42_60]HBY05382.1 adenylate kinase [Candidatus Dependentiae bacterium]